MVQHLVMLGNLRPANGTALPTHVHIYINSP
jgi:hypothetical protein